MNRPQPKRVGLLSNSAWSLVNFRREFILALVERGYEVVAFAPDDRYSAALQSLGARVVSLHAFSQASRNPLRDLLLLREITAGLRAARLDVLFSYTPKANIYGGIAARLLGLRFFPTINGLGYSFQENGWLPRIVSRLYRIGMVGAERIFVQNEEIVRQLTTRRMARRENIVEVAGSGVDLEKFHPATPSGAGAVNFMMCARLIREKGVVEYLEAARAVRELHPEARFTLYGVPAINPSALPERTISAYCDFPGMAYHSLSDDMPAAFRDCDVFVLPSYYQEGVPRGLLEALASARPVLTTDNVGCRQTVARDNGMLVRPRDVADLVRGMRAMIALGPAERQAMGQRGRQLAEERYDLRSVVRSYLGVLGARQD